MREFDFYIASWKRKTINIANYKPWAFGVRYVRRIAIKSLCEEHIDSVMRVSATCLLIGVFGAGLIVGHTIWPKEKVVEEKYVSERIKSCELLGGKYRLYNGWDEKYVERCFVSEKEITNF